MITTALILGLLCLAFVSASEVALFSISSLKLKTYRHSEDKRLRLVSEILSQPRDLLITLIILNVVLSILIQNIVSALFGEFSGWLLSVGVPLVLILIFGEVIPKSIALVRSEEIAPLAAGPISIIKKILLPVSRSMVFATNALSRIIFFFLKKEREISNDELQHTLRTSRLTGVLSSDEADLMRGYLNLQNATAKELMRPREEVLFFELDEPLSRLIHLFVDQECTRIPICKEGLDQVIGIMTSGRFFLARGSLNETSDLLPHLKKPFFVPEAIPAHNLLEQMYAKKESLAMVVDEYGSLSGLLALEDLVEVVVGEIIDRRDEKSRYTRSGEDVIIASGKLEIMELENLFDVELKSENNMVTVGGWLTEQLGDIPKSGTKYQYNNLLFHVLSSDIKRVRRVYIRRFKSKKI